MAGRLARRTQPVPHRLAEGAPAPSGRSGAVALAGEVRLGLLATEAGGAADAGEAVTEHARDAPSA